MEVRALGAELAADHYDHTSVLKTLESLFGVKNLTSRDGNAHGLMTKVTLTTPRTDCPVLTAPAAAEPPPWTEPSPEERARTDAQPLPESGNIWGFLATLGKTEIELLGGEPQTVAEVRARYEQTTTYGDARAHFERVMALVEAARAHRARPREE